MQSLVADILAAWRRAERLAGTLPPHCPEQAAAQHAGERLRDLYRDLTTPNLGTDPDARRMLAEPSGIPVPKTSPGP